ncbi:MAG: glycosyltransferase 87 family protein [Solirubrobacterales bacterium]
MLRPLVKRWGPCLLVGVVSAWLATRATSIGDWGADGGPAVEALAAGHVGEYLRWSGLTGPFATAVQAPFVALSGGSGAAAYQWAVFPCLFGAGLVGLYLGRVVRRRGGSQPAQVLLPLLFLLNPITFEALRNGHPEEILTAALLVAALAAAAERHSMGAALFLGLAVASKQWAVIGALPVLLVLPAHRLKTGIIAAAIAGALFLPSIVASPDSFLGAQKVASGTPQNGVAGPLSAWYPMASSTTVVSSVHGEHFVAHVEHAPELAASVSHSLIVLLALALPLVVAWRRGLPLSPSDGFALLALLALLRCVLDPVDNLYYHEPLLLAFVGWDAVSPRTAPLRTLLAVAAALVLSSAWRGDTGLSALNAVYLLGTGALGAWLVSSLFGWIPWTRVQKTQFSRKGTQISGIKSADLRSM